MELEIIQKIIQGGAVGISVLLIAYSAWKDKLFNKTLNNHLEHTHQSDMKLAEEIKNLSVVIAGRKKKR